MWIRQRGCLKCDAEDWQSSKTHKERVSCANSGARLALAEGSMSGDGAQLTDGLSRGLREHDSSAPQT